MTAAVREASSERPDHEVLVIGAGFSGIGAAIGLQRAGVDDFVILDERDGAGGTWHINTYPGIAVDITGFVLVRFRAVASMSASFPPAELKSYADHCIDKFAIRSAFVWARRWRRPRTTSRRTSDVMLGRHADDGALRHLRHRLAHGRSARHPGALRFQGDVVHTAAWDHAPMTAGASP